MKLKYMYVWAVYVFLFGNILHGQSQLPEIEVRLLKQKLEHLDFLKEEFEINSKYFDSKTGLIHVYLQQTLDGIKINGATASLHLNADLHSVHSTNQFIENPLKLRSRNSQTLKELQVVKKLCRAKNVSLKSLDTDYRFADNKHKFTLTNESTGSIELLELQHSYYFDSIRNEIKRSYSIFWKRDDVVEWLSLIVDAVSGETLSEVNQIQTCAFDNSAFNKSHRFTLESKTQHSFGCNSCYRVYPMPVESPVHGSRQLVMSPWLKAPDASPFGWHGDGINFYYSTRGNNTDTYEDSDDDDMPTGGDFARAYGGQSLDFDFTYDPLLPPFSNKDAALSNLFYWTNLMHDVWYQYGFDEAAGNFQMNNSNRGGIGNDHILAQGLDNVYFARNNATFATPVDGANGIMQIYLWNYPVRDTIIIDAPPAVSGKYVFVHAPVTPQIYAPVSAQLVLAMDQSSYPSYACSNLINASQIAGKIAMVDRGICSFSSKMSRLQNAGAVAVIVCHNEDNDISGIGGWSYGLSIPAVMMRKSDCQTLKIYLNQGVVGNLLPSAALKFSVLQQEYIFSRAKFGKSFQNLSGTLVQVLDSGSNTKDACDFISNGFELNGKIALMDDGNCDATYKIMQVQNYGAIAAVLCKQGTGYPDTIANGNYAHLVNIPVIKISQADCQKIRLQIPANAQFRNNSPALVDGSFDAGIICHEYGHGISTRLTGGPNNVSCLNNAEQMGEGWSDFFGLAMTLAPGDHAYKSRGMGTFSSCQGNGGSGIRPFPYHVSLAMNPADYNMVEDVTTISAPHGIGYIWCSMIWDLLWAFVKQYGLETDIYNSNSNKGNTKVYRLIIEAMKLQPCNPGFVDARNAILKADTLLFGASNACVIWNVFARRGLGFNANQGSPYSRTDGTPDYNIPAQCSWMSEKLLFEQSQLAAQTIDLFAVPDQDQIKLFWKSDLQFTPLKWILFKKSQLSERVPEKELCILESNQLAYADLDVQTDVDYYYQLHVQGVNGLKLKSKWVLSKISASSKDWYIYPNPVGSICHLKSNKTYSGNLNIKLYDPQLNLIDQAEMIVHQNDHVQMQTGDLMPGLYLINLHTETGIQTLKFIKN